MVYAFWLWGISALFVIVERLWPRERRGLWRPGLATDVSYLVFNSEYVGVLVGWLAVPLFTWWHLDRLGDGLLRPLPMLAQLAVILVAFDFTRWWIHYLMHRLPALWEFHKVHHSIQHLDWVGNWRFHWMEVVIYRVLLYPVAALCGASPEALFWCGVASTFSGHFTHSNTALRLGALRFLLVGPAMHAWHHAHPQAGPVDRNFGLMFSVWDWLFGTAYLPAETAPGRLGFDGIERYPNDPLRQALAPFVGLWRGLV